MTNKVNCYNRGCGQEFDPQNNPEESCRYHPGVPVFHDAYKGWSCCNKKSTDFTEFLNIKGCTLSKHSNEKPPEPEKPKKEAIEEEEPKLPTPLNKEVRLERPSLSTPLTTVVPKVNPNFKQQIDSLLPAPTDVKRLAELVEEVSIGTKCRHRGCEAAYNSPASNHSECIFHPGVPIFHEGMKYWSCCQRKTSDFTAFMSQKGCESGRHKWLKEDHSSEVKCRWDWHQTARDVVVSVYAKMYDYKRSFVKLSPIRLNVELVFPQQNDHKFVIDLELRGIIKVESSSVSMMGTKVEIVMAKAEPGSWSKLEVPKKVELKQEQVVEEKKEEDADSDVDLDDLAPEFGEAAPKVQEV